jgi:hypothetical protein
LKRSKSKNSAPLLSYVPYLLPDELLYSFLGRLAAYNKFTNPREYLKTLFGTKDIIPSTDLTSGLKSLQRSLGAESPFESVERIIDSATIYPYHRPFLTLERHERAHAILLNGGGKGLKTMLGRVANRFGANPSLRYCPKCRQEDLDRDGAPYWHRMHQLPGVASCATHGVDLVPFILPSQSSYRERFQLVPTALPDAALRPHETTGVQIRFAQISAELLGMNLPILGPERWKTAYQVAASRHGFTDSNGRVRYHLLAEALRNHYHDFSGFQHQQRILSTPKNPLGWLRTIFGRPYRSSHPIFHLLLMGFFWGTVKDFVALVQNGQEIRPLKGESEIRLEVKKEESSRTALLRDVSLSARVVAEKLGVSVNTIVSQRRAMGIPIRSRRKRLDEALLSKIHAAMQGGKQPQDIAWELGISLATVYRVRRESAAVLAASLRVRFATLRSLYRSRWRKATKNLQTVHITEARGQESAAYAWLYRNDRTWLVARNVRIPSGRRARKARVDWATRDRQLCEKLRNVYKSLRSVPDRRRISRTALLRPLGESSILKNLARLPRLKSLLDELEESSEDYQKHRIDEAIKTFTQAGVNLSWWRIQRAAGIKTCGPKVKMYALAKILDPAKQP